MRANIPQTCGNKEWKEASASFFFRTVTNSVTIAVYFGVRIIAVKTLKNWCVVYPKAKQSLLAWHEEATSAEWDSPNQLKAQYRSASIISEKRVVFNIHGNSFRLIVDIEYRLKIVFIVWFGTHPEYDKIDVKNIGYAKTNKK